MRLEELISKAARAGTLYNLDHFHTAWEDTALRRLMGNELLYPPSQNVIQAVQNVLPFLNYYPEDPGTAIRLREELAKYLGVSGGADWITLGNGSMEIIDMIPRAFLDEGDEVLLPSPEYSPYYRRPLLCGGRIIDVNPSGDDFTYAFEDFSNRITTKTKMVILSRPNAPVGNMVSRELLEQLLDMRVIVMVDEAYAEFSRQTICGLLCDYPNLVISRTFSKAMGLGGIRFGFMAAQPEMIQIIECVRVPLNVGLISQVAALAALEDAEYIRLNCERVIKTRDDFFSKVNLIDGIKAYPSQGNSVLVNCSDTGKPAAYFVQQLFAAGYLVRDQSHGRGLQGDGFFRITIGTPDDMQAVLQIINDGVGMD